MNSKPKANYAAFIAASLAVVLWASAYPSIALALQGFEPAELAALRYVLAALVLLAMGSRRTGLPARADIPRIILAGAVGIAAYNLLLNSGQRSVDPGTTGLLNNVSPIFAAVLARLFTEERIAPLGWAGICLGFAGAGVVAISRSEGTASIGSGALLILLAAFSFAAQLLIQKPLLARYEPLPVATWVICAGSVFLMPWLPASVSAAIHAPGEALFALFYLAIGPAALAYALWAYVLSHSLVSRSSSFLYMVAPVALLLDYLLFGRIPTSFAILGGLLTLAGVVVVNSWGAYPSRARPERAGNSERQR